MDAPDDSADHIGSGASSPSPIDGSQAAGIAHAEPTRAARVLTATRAHRLFWWKEALIAVAFYITYSLIRNQFGSNRIAATGFPRAAFHNAERVIRWEQALGLYHEPTIQAWALGTTWFIQMWNIFYGTAHFVVTLGVFAVLFWRRPHVFPQWRNSLAAMTALAIVGFVFFPLMPPRLLDEPCPWEQTGSYGGRCISSELRGDDGTFGYVDTLEEYGGLWSFDSRPVASISNQYAAMPSLHIGWATWCAFAVWPLMRRWRSRIAVLLYPLITLYTIVVTGNHFWLDAVGGVLVFAVGALLGWSIHRWNQDRLDRQFITAQGF